MVAELLREVRKLVKTENKKTEKYLFDTLPEALVPFEATVRNGKLTVETFKRTRSYAKEFYKRFKNAPFSDEAISFISDGLAPIVRSWGYYTDDLREGHIITYIASKIDRATILDSTVRIKSGEGYINLTDYELEAISEDSDECYFVTLLDNKIVSVCETNASDAFIGAKEINVYTNPEYRKMGYGASNVTAMVDYYTDLGHRVAYTSRKDNTASCALAEKCGFERLAETYYYICYKEE